MAGATALAFVFVTIKWVIFFGIIALVLKAFGG